MPHLFFSFPPHLQHFSPSLNFSLISHPLTLYILCPQTSISLSPPSPFFSLSQLLHLSFYPHEICPAGFSFFLLSTQLTNPREKEEQLVLHSKRKGWLDGWGGGKKVDGKRDMGSERRRNMGEGDRGRLGDGERQWTWRGKVRRDITEEIWWCRSWTVDFSLVPPQ